MKHLLLALWIVVVGGVAARAELSYTLIPSSPVVAPGAPVEFEMVGLNRGAGAAVWNWTTPTRAVVTAGAAGWKVDVLTGDSGNRKIAPGAFVARRCSVVLPVEAHGAVLLMIEGVEAAPLAIEVKESRRADSLPVIQPASERLQRTFAGRLSANEPIYFIVGPDSPVAKFQFSFKYRILSAGRRSGKTARDALQFGFTQRSLWKINEKSSPFYDTSYMPEVMYESVSTEKVIGGGVTFLGFQAGLKHESNGRDEPYSRSMNKLFLRPAILAGTLDGWHVLVAPEFYAYVGGLSDNPDLKDYRGTGLLRVFIGKNDAPSLMYTGMVGEHGDNVTTQLDLTIPVRIRFMDFETFFLVQYFNGYGESLLSYREHSATVRAGIQLVR